MLGGKLIWKHTSSSGGREAQGRFSGGLMSTHKAQGSEETVSTSPGVGSTCKGPERERAGSLCQGLEEPSLGDYK